MLSGGPGWIIISCTQTAGWFIFCDVAFNYGLSSTQAANPIHVYGGF